MTMPDRLLVPDDFLDGAWGSVVSGVGYRETKCVNISALFVAKNGDIHRAAHIKEGKTEYIRDDPFALAAALRVHGFIVPRITLADGTTEPEAR